MRIKLWACLPISLATAIALSACQSGAPTQAEAIPLVDAEISTPAASQPTIEADSEPPPAEPPQAEGTGSISGRILPPDSSGATGLNVYALRTDGSASYVISLPMQAVYSIDVPPGEYFIFAYQIGGAGTAVGHTEAALCILGLITADCDNHALLPVEVGATQATTKVDIADWNPPADTIPPPPADAIVLGAPQVGQVGGSVTSGSGPGTVSGALRYPSEGHPALRVYAIRIDLQRWQWINVSQNQGSYALQIESPGEYYIVAYVLDGDNVHTAGAFTLNGQNNGDFGACSLGVSTPLALTVAAGDEHSGIDIVDWGDPASYPVIPAD